MKYKEFAVFNKAIDLYRKKLHEESLKAIERQNQVASASWRLTRLYSITGFGDTKPLSEIDLKKLYDDALCFGVSKSDLEPYLKEAEYLWDEWEKSQEETKKKI